MEIYERIRFLRKNHLKLSQAEFGKILGVSRDVIKNIELNVLVKPEQKLSLIKLMCKEFNVNEDWILHGIDPMINKTNVFSFDKFLKEKEATELEIDIMKIYLSLDKGIRRKLMSDFKKVVLKDERKETQQKPTIIRVPARGRYYEIEETEESKAALKRDLEKKHTYNPDDF